jgi:inosine triphosphate pyrophosphatase
MIYFVTGSDNKFGEVQAFIPNIQKLHIDIPEIQEIDAKKIVEAKLAKAVELHDGELIVEDTSLYLECLGGLPGPLVKWFEKTMASKGIAEMAIALGDVRATACSIIGYAGNNRPIEFFEGMIQGTLVLPRVESDFGWDNIFVPDGHTLTFAEMTKEEKGKISMRSIAVKKLKEHLASL